MKTETHPLGDNLVTLEPADATNVEPLIRWTLDPMAQGPHKRVPDMTADELRTLFLANPDRQYFLIRRSANGHPLGRFYWLARLALSRVAGGNRLGAEHILGRSPGKESGLWGHRAAVGICLPARASRNPERVCLDILGQCRRAARAHQSRISGRGSASPCALSCAPGGASRPALSSVRQAEVGLNLERPNK
jgi:hypothetical protein